MKTFRNPQKNGPLGQLNDSAREKLLGVACYECGHEIHYSLTTFHRGFPAIRCRNCGKQGYMIRSAREGGRLIWFRSSHNAGGMARELAAQKPESPTKQNG